MFQKVRIYIWKKVGYFELRKLCGYPLWISFPELCTTPVLRQSLCLLRVPRDKQASTLFFVKFTCALSRSVVSDLCDPMDCSQPGSSVHGIFQARILEWLPFASLGSSWPGERTCVSCSADGFFPCWAITQGWILRDRQVVSFGCTL